MWVKDTYTLEEVFHAMEEAHAQGRPTFTLPRTTQAFSLNNARYNLFFTQGITCLQCGKQATCFRLEAGTEAQKPHLNLYREEVTPHTGLLRVVLYTKDHIIPKSWGGPNKASNYQVMCAPCNRKKGNAYAGTLKAKYAREKVLATTGV